MRFNNTTNPKPKSKPKPNGPRVRNDRPKKHSGKTSGKSNRYKIIWGKAEIGGTPLTKKELDEWRAQGHPSRLEVTGHVNLDDPKNIRVDMLWKMSSSPDIPTAMDPLRQCAYWLRGP